MEFDPVILTTKQASILLSNPNTWEALHLLPRKKAAQLYELWATEDPDILASAIKAIL